MTENVCSVYIRALSYCAGFFNQICQVKFTVCILLDNYLTSIPARFHILQAHGDLLDDPCSGLQEYCLCARAKCRLQPIKK